MIQDNKLNETIKLISNNSNLNTSSIIWSKLFKESINHPKSEIIKAKNKRD